ncbi:MAG: aldehyde dehydrogenase family protein [Gammaproteobacteria bacterium]|nr:MAG: aldehyde dehydrogenase family protein [Gammaproteobacteria bacterium]
MSSSHSTDYTRFYINGEWVAPLEGRDCAVLDPSTEEPFTNISLGGEADTNAAVAAARAAFPSWAASSKEERLDALKRLKAAYLERADDMAKAISREMGAPIDMAQSSQMPSGLHHIDDAIRTLERFEFEGDLGEHAPGARIHHDPIGVVGMITPWNWPMNQVTLKVAPALAAGCTMVLKPSEESPISSLILAECVEAAGIPAGVFNLVNGDGMGVGSQLSMHPDVDMISFTGSTRAGAAISKAAADTVKRVSLELGGKGANLVFTDADEEAVSRGVRHCFGNSGQSCNAPTRMLVQRDRYEEAVAQAQQVAESIKVGPASEHGSHIGPVVNERQYERIQSLIQQGIDDGSRLIAGGLGRAGGYNKGWFVRPTVFADVQPGSTLWREEVFGPVLGITPFDTEEEGLALANDTRYGLTNYVQTSDRDRARRLARLLRSGMVEINGQSRGAGAPFGGFGQSGNGREGGVWGLEEYLEVKSIGGW